MNKITIDKIHLKNFCAFEEKIVELNNKSVLIEGDNETGKSSILSAITWILFNTDIKSNFNPCVVPIGAEDSVVTSATLHLIKNGHPVVIEKQVLKNTSTFSVNKEEYKPKEFKEFLCRLLPQERLLPVVMQPRFFIESFKVSNEANWYSQRQTMLELVQSTILEKAKEDKKYEELKQWTGEEDFNTNRILKTLKTKMNSEVEKIENLTKEIEIVEKYMISPKIEEKEICKDIETLERYLLKDAQNLRKALWKEVLITLRGVYQETSMLENKQKVLDLIQDEVEKLEITFATKLKDQEQLDTSALCNKVRQSCLWERHTRDTNKILELEQQIVKSKTKYAECCQQIELLQSLFLDNQEELEKEINDFLAPSDLSVKLFQKNKTNNQTKEIFELRYKGKEYSTQLSNSTQLYATMQLLYLFQNRFDISFPLLIDNAESTNFNWFDNDRQIIVTNVKSQNCPSCNNISGRRSGQKWLCYKCGDKFEKDIKITELNLKTS